MSKKLFLVIQRFGTEIVGGAENHALMLIRHVLLPLGYEVEVLSSTSVSNLMWDKLLRAGVSELEPGLTVRRFDPLQKRNSKKMLFFRIILTFLRLFSLSMKSLEKKWIEAQGPYCPQIPQFLREHKDQCQGVVFFSYLYFPTLFGLPEVAQKSFLVPTAHDEFPFYFKLVRKIFSQTKILLINSPAEKALILKTHGFDLSGKIKEAGVGLVFPDIPIVWDWAKRLPISERRLVYLGRIGHGKSCDQLVNDFQALSKNFKEENGLTLFLAGEVEPGFSVPDDPLIQYAGRLTEEEKWLLIQSAYCVVNPSRYESLSLLVHEAVGMGKPVLVNEKSEVLKALSSEYKMVLPYLDELTFKTCLTFLFECEENIENQLKIDAQRARQKLSWSRVQEVYRQSFFELSS